MKRFFRVLGIVLMVFNGILVVSILFVLISFLCNAEKFAGEDPATLLIILFVYSAFFALGCKLYSIGSKKQTKNDKNADVAKSNDVRSYSYPVHKAKSNPAQSPASKTHDSNNRQQGSASQRAAAQGNRKDQRIHELRINDRNKLFEFAEQISLQSIVSMEVETSAGSGLEGISWDYLKYVYNPKKDRNRSPAWIDYTVINRDSISLEGLVSDFDDLQKHGTAGSCSTVIILYDEESVPEAPASAPTFTIKQPDGFIQVNQIYIHKEYLLGFSYEIEMLSIVRNSDGTLYLREYSNWCTSEANGKPSTTIRDVCYKLNSNDDISRINENNWKKYIPHDELLSPTFVFEETNGTYVDQQALNFAKEDTRRQAYNNNSLLSKVTASIDKMREETRGILTSEEAFLEVIHREGLDQKVDFKMNNDFTHEGSIRLNKLEDGSYELYHVGERGVDTRERFQDQFEAFYTALLWLRHGPDV